MKRIITIMVLCLAFSVNAFAESDASQHSTKAISLKLLNFNFTNGPSEIGFKFRKGEFCLSTLLVVSSSDSRTTYSTYDLSREDSAKGVLLGFRNYFRQSEDSLFTEIKTGYSVRNSKRTYDFGSQPKVIDDSELKTRILTVGFFLGGEHYFSEKFSIEGMLGFYLSNSKGTGSDESKSTEIGSYDAGLSANYYF